MAETKEYVLAILEALDRIEGYRTIDLFQMQDGFSEFWAPIFDEFKAKRVISDGTINGYPVNKPYVTMLKAEYRQKLKKIEEDEEERALRLIHIRVDIQQIRSAKRLAWISIIISIASVIAQVLYK